MQIMLLYFMISEDIVFLLWGSKVDLWSKNFWKASIKGKSSLYFEKSFQKFALFFFNIILRLLQDLKSSCNKKSVKTSLWTKGIKNKNKKQSLPSNPHFSLKKTLARYKPIFGVMGCHDSFFIFANLDQISIVE